MDINNSQNNNSIPSQDPVQSQGVPVSNGGNDISKTTITVLVLLTLMISVIGTWTVLNEVSNVRMTQQSSVASGKVTLTLQSDKTQNPPVEQKSTNAATGQVIFEVKGN